MELLHRLSIRHKLLLSMGLTLLLFIIISSTLSIMKTSQAARERVLRQELPAQVSAIRNDVLRQIATPLAVSQTLVNNTFLHAWEDAGVPDEGVAAWTAQAKDLKSKNNAATVFWVSRSTGKSGLLERLSVPANFKWLAATVICAFIANLMILRSIQLSNATLASIVEITYPLFTVAFSYMLFRTNTLNWDVAFGGTLIFIGVLWISLRAAP